MPKASCRGCGERWIAAIWRIGRIGWALERNLRTFCDSSTEPNVPGRGVQSRDQQLQRPQPAANPRGSVSLVTKSGTNDFHGDVFEFFRKRNFQRAEFLRGATRYHQA